MDDTNVNAAPGTAEAAGLPTLYMNDISRPHGGPMAGLHASHQVGLDADVWLDVSPKPELTPAARDAVEGPAGRTQVVA